MRCNPMPARLLATLCALSSSLLVSTGRAEVETELVLFPSAVAVHRSGAEEETGLDRHDAQAGVDLFFTLEKNRFRMLGELLLSTEEQDLERLQVGWVTTNHRFWLGRFHNPIGYWNTEFHHGSHLQTSISRPRIVEFEEMGGILPTHQGGLLIEGRPGGMESPFGYALSVGLGPEFGDQLEALHILEPGEGDQDISGTANLFLRSGADDQHRVGMFASLTRIPARSIGVNEIRQTTAGAYMNREYADWRVLGAAFWVENEFRRPDGATQSDFFQAYVQAEYRLAQQVVLFGRLESTFSDGDDPYLALFPQFVRERTMGGVRFDFARHHALKLELSADEVESERFNRIAVEWSALF